MDEVISECVISNSWIRRNVTSAWYRNDQSFRITFIKHSNIIIIRNNSYICSPFFNTRKQKWSLIWTAIHYSFSINLHRLSRCWVFSFFFHNLRWCIRVLFLLRNRFNSKPHYYWKIILPTRLIARKFFLHVKKTSNTFLLKQLAAKLIYKNVQRLKEI